LHGGDVIRFFRPDLHVLAGAYSVDAIGDQSERARFERHMRRCQQCADEVRGMAATTTRLGFAASAVPPPQLRDYVLAAVSRTRQLPPVVDHGSVPTEPRPRRIPAR
jgi:anti-sigma factor RsiW